MNSIDTTTLINWMRNKLTNPSLPYEYRRAIQDTIIYIEEENEKYIQGLNKQYGE